MANLRSIKIFSLFFVLFFIWACNKKSEIFTETYRYIWKDTPFHLSSGNFNKDDLPDVIISDWGDNIIILLNKSNGVLDPASITPGYHSYIKDLNGDGIDDVISGMGDIFLVDENGVVTNTYNVDIKFLEDDIVIDTSPITGNFNLDDIIDFVIRTFFKIVMFLGRGEGNFEGKIIYEYNKNETIKAPPLRFLGAGDFNRDGISDVIGSNYDNSLGVMLGNSDGTLNDSKYYETEGCPKIVVIEDINKDGIEDIISGGDICGWGFGPPLVTFFKLKDSSLNTFQSYDIDYISILLGKGDGRFAPAVSYPVGESPRFLIIDDFNLDGIKDIAVLLYNNGISILLGKGDGDFELPEILGAGECPFKLVKGDFNGDGIKDLGVLNSCESKDYVQILLGDGAGGFRDVGSYDPGFYAHQIIAVDFNLDGLTDLVVAGKRVLEGGYYDSEGEYHPGVSECQLSVLLANGGK